MTARDWSGFEATLGELGIVRVLIRKVGGRWVAEVRLRSGKVVASAGDTFQEAFENVAEEARKQ